MFARRRPRTRRPRRSRPATSSTSTRRGSRTCAGRSSPNRRCRPWPRPSASLGDPTRVRLLDALSHGELCVCDLATLVGLSESATSHQLRLLRTLRLVRPGAPAGWSSTRSTTATSSRCSSRGCGTSRSRKRSAPGDSWRERCPGGRGAVHQVRGAHRVGLPRRRDVLRRRSCDPRAPPAADGRRGRAQSADILGQKLHVAYDAAVLDSRAHRRRGGRDRHARLARARRRRRGAGVASRHARLALAGAAIAAGLRGAAGRRRGRLVVGRRSRWRSPWPASQPARKAWLSLKRRSLDIHVLMVVAVAGAMAIGEWAEGGHRRLPLRGLAVARSADDGAGPRGHPRGDRPWRRPRRG